MADFSSLNGINSAAYTNYMIGNEYSKKMQETVGKTADKNATDEELMDACKEFEAYFLEQVYKEMSGTVDAFKRDDSDMSNALSMTSSNSLVDYFKSQTLQSLAVQTSETQSTGLAAMLYENLKRNMGEDPGSISQ
ncbi:hypothetical protein [Butyrivibrio sp. MC2013]|uniref:hypothetical protein n=1 Tax=Butyrivibrio sp. MC2013 TaxID=1280686 RepID=UPI000428AE17|nr:hypothetical protein [Butyrivibrio sp. MC2013]